MPGWSHLGGPPAGDWPARRWERERASRASGALLGGRRAPSLIDLAGWSQTRPAPLADRPPELQIGEQTGNRRQPG
jgi:hypothetical protein